MENKKIIFIAIIAVIIIIGAISAYFAINQEETSSFNNKFIEGKFIGNVSQVNSSNNNTTNQWLVSYKDNTNNVEYNMSTCKNATFLIDYLSLQGLKGPENRNYNGIDWNIYFSQAVPNVGNNTTNQSNITYNIYICEANKDNQSYLIYIINTDNGTNSGSKLQCDGSMYCDLYTKNIEPLLKSVKLKHNDNAPEIYELLGLSQSDFNNLNNYLEQYKAGNINANGTNVNK